MLLRAVLLLALCRRIGVHGSASSGPPLPRARRSSACARPRTTRRRQTPSPPTRPRMPRVSPQGMPLALDDRLSHYVFFLSLATLTVTWREGAEHAPPEAPDLSVYRRCSRPFSSASLGALYYCITVLELDPSLVYRARARPRARRAPRERRLLVRSASPTPTPPTARVARERRRGRGRRRVLYLTRRARARRASGPRCERQLPRVGAGAATIRAVPCRFGVMRCCRRPSATTCTSSSSAT